MLKYIQWLPLMRLSQMASLHKNIMKFVMVEGRLDHHGLWTLNWFWPLIVLVQAKLGSLRVRLTWIDSWVTKGESCQVWLRFDMIWLFFLMIIRFNISINVWHYWICLNVIAKLSYVTWKNITSPHFIFCLII